MRYIECWKDEKKYGKWYIFREIWLNYLNIKIGIVWDEKNSKWMYRFSMYLMMMKDVVIIYRYWKEMEEKDVK